MKFENANFSKEDLEVINSYEPLADWFKRNEFQITYLGLTTPHFESYFDQNFKNDSAVLERMSNIAMCWIQDSTYSNKEKAVYASIAINKIFDESKGVLSQKFLNNAFIKANFNNFGEEVDVLNPPKLFELEYNILQNKKNQLLQELQTIDARMNEISSAQKSVENKTSGIK